jgi:hypothetical protein
LRVHKGAPFHNLALSLLYQGRSKEALTYSLYAYIEDVIGSEKPGECDNLPASRAICLERKLGYMQYLGLG